VSVLASTWFVHATAIFDKLVINSSTQSVVVGVIDTTHDNIKNTKA
jgi:hypothetical protein